MKENAYLCPLLFHRLFCVPLYPKLTEVKSPAQALSLLITTYLLSFTCAMGQGFTVEKYAKEVKIDAASKRQSPPVIGSMSKVQEGRDMDFHSTQVWLAILFSQSLPKVWAIDIDKFDRASLFHRGEVLEESGRLVPMSKKQLPFLKSVLKFEQKAELDTVWILIEQSKGKSTSTANLAVVPYKEWESDYQSQLASTNLEVGFLEGVFLILAIYHLLMWAIVKDRLYGYHAGVILSSAFMIPKLVEINYYWYLLPEVPYLHQSVGDSSVLANICFYLLFVSYFTESKKHFSRWHTVLRASFFAMVAVAILGFSTRLLGFDNSLVNTSENFVLLACSLVSILFTFTLFFHSKQKANRYLIIGSLAYFGGYVFAVAIYFLFQTLPIFLVKAGVVLELMLFSLAIGEKIRKDQLLRMDTQKRLLEQLKANEAIQKNINQRLEREVEARTSEVTAQNEELRQNQEEITAQRDFIAITNRELQAQQLKMNDSISAAQIIQQAILPSEESFSNHYSDFFILYHPKDVVSGDFYWIHSDEESTILLVADCTGHGVPGAFTTMIGHLLANQVVVQGNMRDPGEILESFHQGFYGLLKQKTNRNHAGMDAGVVIWHHSSEKVSFAGAKMDVLYSYPEYDTFVKVEGTRRSVGGLVRKSNLRPFEAHELPYKKGVRYYLYTDGYADQSDESRKRFGKQNLIKLIESLAKFPLAKQREHLELRLVEYRGNALQRDDILVIGVQL